MSVSPNCDSDEEIYWGPVTAKELEREWRRRKLKRRAFSPNDARFDESLYTNYDESAETKLSSNCIEKNCSDQKVELKAPESMGKASSKNKIKLGESSIDQKAAVSNHNVKLCPIGRDVIIAGDYSLISSEEEQECNDFPGQMIPESPNVTPCKDKSSFSNESKPPEYVKVETSNNCEYLCNLKESTASVKSEVKNIDLETSKVVGNQIHDSDEILDKKRFNKNPPDSKEIKIPEVVEIGSYKENKINLKGIEVARKEIHGLNKILYNQQNGSDSIKLKDQNNVRSGAENVCENTFYQQEYGVSYMEEDKNLLLTRNEVPFNGIRDSDVILDNPENQLELKEMEVKDGSGITSENIFNMKELGLSHIENNVNLKGNNINDNYNILYIEENTELKEIKVCDDIGLVAENSFSQKESGVSFIEECKNVDLKGNEVIEKEINDLDDDILGNEKSQIEFKKVELGAENINENSFNQQKLGVSYMEVHTNVNLKGNEVNGNEMHDTDDILNNKVKGPELKELKCQDDVEIGAKNIFSQKESGVSFIEECKNVDLEGNEVIEKEINVLDDILAKEKSQIEFKKVEIGAENINENSFNQNELRVSYTEVDKNVNIKGNEVAGNKMHDSDDILDKEMEPELKELKCQKDNNVKKMLDFHSLCNQNKGAMIPELKHLKKFINYRDQPVVEINEPSPIKNLNNCNVSTKNNNISSCKFQKNTNLIKPAKIILPQSPSISKKIPISGIKSTTVENSPNCSISLVQNSVSNLATNLPTVAKIKEIKKTKSLVTGSKMLPPPSHLIPSVPQKNSPTTTHNKTRTFLKSPAAVNSFLKPASANLTPAKPLIKTPYKLKIPVPITNHQLATGMKSSSTSKQTGLKPPTPMKPQMLMKFSALNKPPQSTTSFTPIKGNSLFKHPTPVKPPTPKKTNMIGKEIRSPVADYIHKSPTLNAIPSKALPKKNDTCQENEWPSENIDSTNILSTEVHIKPLYYSASKKKIEIRTPVDSHLPVMGERQKRVFTSPQVVIKKHLARVNVPNLNKEADVKDPSRPSYFELPSDCQIGDSSVLLCKDSGL